MPRPRNGTNRSLFAIDCPREYTMPSRVPTAFSRTSPSAAGTMNAPPLNAAPGADVVMLGG